MTTNQAFYTLLAFAEQNQLIDPSDHMYACNRLMDVLGMTVPPPATPPVELPKTATALLDTLIDDATARGICDATSLTVRESMQARIMNLFTARPSDIGEHFQALEADQGIGAAIDWFYALSKANNYIRVDDIARNEAFSTDTPVGTLDITINLSKPEKTPEEIALLKKNPPTGYPACLLCLENVGYAGHASHPPRFNLRTLPMALAGDTWHFQYSPYAYYNEHCIVLNAKHTDMALTRQSFERLFAFIDRVPHYFIGSNADLPIVGGSILNHDHFQGGNHTFPMTRASMIKPVRLTKYPQVQAGIVKWPLTTLRLRATDASALIEIACETLDAWRNYSDPSQDVLAYSEENGVRTPHNTITPTLRRDGELYVLDLVLRNNRTTSEHPRGIFHPHADLHHIKQENIGLIEVMGLFILPGRLKTELRDVAKAIELGITPTDANDPLYKHREWIAELQQRFDGNPDHITALIQQGLGEKCARVLIDAGVFKQTEPGLEAFSRFLQTLHMEC